MASVNIQPLEDKILVEANEAETTTASGLVIPDTAKEKPQRGRVLLVPARDHHDERVAIPASSRISPPSWQIGIHERFASIGPDRAKAIAPFKVLVDPVGQNDELHRIGVN